ncbi:hypothetical protein D9Q98_010592 [Chlorella vulgaris]|uniref:superoxide dismutase n=1 Tax=Chlorella vulgaris TaxID=3077 RepID=A0A9D4TQF6_CHLVU|nr:hypothetical protein D9Q98_010592 [Chlorella vulgaris]
MQSLHIQVANVPLRAAREQPGSGGSSPGSSEVQVAAQEQQQLGGEDAAVFSFADQSARSWGIFAVLLTGVLALLYPVWIAPGQGLGDDFIAALSSLSSDSSVVILAILAVFAAAHSGLAYLRPYGEELVGARAYRVVFALVSLPLAIAAVVYFIDHRYDGVPLWNIRGIPGVHEAVWSLSLLSFYFLYPSTFNILEVAAVDEPKLHMWETGIMRITRHPQMVGQAIWCFAHTAWIGSSFMVVTSLGLMAHHLFGCWHGDYRLKRKYGDAFEAVKSRTSTLPFAAILEGRQQLPKDYYKEFLRGPYLLLLPFCVGTYLAHPLMQRASYFLGCISTTMRPAMMLLCLAAFAAAASAQNYTLLTLDDLPYQTTDFEPSIDNMTMVFHWTRHSNAFVNNLNNLILPVCPELGGKPLIELVRAVGTTKKCNKAQLEILGIKAGVRGRCPAIKPECETLVKNNAGGLWNHALFFLHNLAPAGSQNFESDASQWLKDAMWDTFGSLDDFKTQFSAAAASVFGSGWAWVVVDDGELKIVTTPNQDNPLLGNAPAKGLPILGLDVWEHAHYLKYYNVRADYIAAFYDVINWKGVSDLYAAALQGADSYDELDVLTPAANWQ